MTSISFEFFPPKSAGTEAKLWDVVNELSVIGLSLTESFAMWPGASVSGLYFSHPDSAYFGVGKINRDQVVDYAERKGMTLEICEKWMAPILSYKS